MVIISVGEFFGEGGGVDWGYGGDGGGVVWEGGEYLGELVGYVIWGGVDGCVGGVNGDVVLG